MRSQNVRGRVASNSKRTIDLIDLKPYFHGRAHHLVAGSRDPRLQTGSGPFIRKGQVFGEVHLRQILSSYAMYYNEVRTTNARSGKEKAHG
jgi:hypothetical protein